MALAAIADGADAAASSGSAGAAPPAGAPDVILMVVDTLRADHLGAYGYGRATSPQIDRELAARGTLFERAYAPAPWTLPSIIALFTGRWPGELLRGRDVGSFAMPKDVPSLAERMARRGYRTAAFVGNPTLNRERGFARGFERYYSPPGGLEAMRLSAADVGERVLSYLDEEHDPRPLFLYVHWIDPHDPYAGPEAAAARPNFNPGYSGAVDGEWPQGLSFGQRELPDPPNDLRQLVALYDGEIAHVDEWIGKLVRALGARSPSRSTLFALTSDHGEELGDHGGWKHGHALYQEQIHVPLILRWDGKVTAGSRVAEPVSLIDLVPTVLAATADRAAPATAARLVERTADSARRFAGIDLLGALDGGGLPPNRPLYVEHLQSGPARAAVIRGSAKYILFDREAPRPAGLRGVDAFFWNRDVARLSREELYDLARDAAERRNAAAAASAVGTRRELESLLRRFVSAAGPSPENRPAASADDAFLAASDLREGENLDVTLRIRPVPSRCVGWFAGARDRIERRGEDWVAHLQGDGTLKQVRCDVAPSAVLLGVAAVDTGGPRDSRSRVRVFLGPGRDPRSLPVAMRDLVASWPPAERAAGVSLWTAPRNGNWAPAARPSVASAADAADAASDEQLRAQLLALGYLQ
jgi:arylsulfatase A-like enzyme